MAEAWQEHGKTMAGTGQEHGEDMVRAGKGSDKPRDIEAFAPGQNNKC